MTVLLLLGVALNALALLVAILRRTGKLGLLLLSLALIGAVTWSSALVPHLRTLWIGLWPA